MRRSVLQWAEPHFRGAVVGTPGAIETPDGMTPDELRSQLASAFPDAEIEVVDLTGTQDHYQARIVSAAFEGKTLVQQHQLVYRALGAALDGAIHALGLKTYTPKTWTQMQRGFA